MFCISYSTRPGAVLLPSLLLPALVVSINLLNVTRLSLLRLVDESMPKLLSFKDRCGGVSFDGFVSNPRDFVELALSSFIIKLRVDFQLSACVAGLIGPPNDFCFESGVLFLAVGD